MSLSSLLTLVISCCAALALGWFGITGSAWIVRRRPFLNTEVLRFRLPVTAVLVTSAALGSLSSDLDGDTWSAIRHVVDVLLIGAVTWLLVAASRVAEDIAARRLNIDTEDNRRARKMRTQIGMVRRIVTAVLVVVGTSVALMTFDRMRTLGASLLASAGIASIVGALAAQSTLTSVFAGLQLAFSDKLRIDDVVVMEDEWGRVEEITLTYVVVHLWDERRLVLPTTYFTTQPFQNWTRTSARVLGAVELYVDFRTPVDDLRAEAERIVKRNPLWDGGTFVLQVTDSTEVSMQIRVLASASDASRAFDLRCDVREQLIGWINRQAPASVPQMRIARPDLRQVDGHRATA